MSLGVIGLKRGMTRIFTEEGESIPVTVVQIEPNNTTQVKTVGSDGYNAIQVTTGVKKRSRVNGAEGGHYAKANVAPGRGLWEFRLTNQQVLEVKIGGSTDVSIFEVGQKVDVAGRSKGKGFQGCVKRHNFSMQDATHGNSLSHRVHGSTGQNQTPGRVFKGKKMAGHMGNVRSTMQNLRVISVDSENGLLLLRGGIPGAKGSSVVITPAIKVNSCSAAGR